MPNFTISLNQVQTYHNLYPTATRYAIRYTENLPADARVYLCIGSAGNRFDITGGYDQDTHLVQLLRCFRGLRQWGQEVDCWLTADLNNSDPFPPMSAVRKIKPPVQPLDWPTNTERIRQEIPRLTYPGNGYGRVLSPLFDGVRYFYIGGCYETDQANRGFDCTTFPEALYCDFFPNGYPNISTGASAPIIATELDAVMCDMEGLPAEELRSKLDQAADGVYLVWIHYHHILLCRVDNWVGGKWFHEFTYGGYVRTRLSERELGGTMSARRLPPRCCGRVISLTDDAQPTASGNTRPGPKSGMGSGKPATGPGGASPGNPGSQTPANGGVGSQTYIVKSGDSLSLIAGRYWNDVLLWPILYDANRKVVGPDPNKIVPNQKLSVPNIKNYSSQQLSDARSRGRNWR